MNLCMINNLGWFLGVLGFGICMAVCMFVFYEMVQLCGVICAQIHAYVSVIIVNRREGLVWEREEWIVLNGVKDKIVF